MTKNELYKLDIVIDDTDLDETKPLAFSFSTEGDCEVRVSIPHFVDLEEAFITAFVAPKGNNVGVSTADVTSTSFTVKTQDMLGEGGGEYNDDVNVGVLITPKGGDCGLGQKSIDFGSTTLESDKDKANSKEITIRKINVPLYNVSTNKRDSNISGEIKSRDCIQREVTMFVKDENGLPSRHKVNDALTVNGSLCHYDSLLRMFLSKYKVVKHGIPMVGITRSDGENIDGYVFAPDSSSNIESKDSIRPMWLPQDRDCAYPPEFYIESSTFKRKYSCEDRIALSNSLAEITSIENTVAANLINKAFPAPTYSDDFSPLLVKTAKETLEKRYKAENPISYIIMGDNVRKSLEEGHTTWKDSDSGAVVRSTEAPSILCGIPVVYEVVIKDVSPLFDPNELIIIPDSAYLGGYTDRGLQLEEVGEEFSGEYIMSESLSVFMRSIPEEVQLRFKINNPYF